MAPPPEYDKEPKAPDKSVTNISSEETKSILSQSNEHQTTFDNKPANSTASSEVENNKHIAHLDDGQLKALLDEAITYKCRKDRESKSILFNELLEKVEQDDEQALEAAAARELSGSRAARRGQRPRRHLAHSNSLQNLEQEALAAESALRRVRHAHPHTTVSARAIHGGSLPSDVDKSFLLSEEGGGRAGYLATVQCYNPPPLHERRVSASDANSPTELDVINKRNKPPFPMMYTARATLEIGSGSVGSARATTTTTHSNQVRTGHLPSSTTATTATTATVTTSSDTQHSINIHKRINVRKIKLQKLPRIDDYDLETKENETKPQNIAPHTDIKSDDKIDSQTRLLCALTKRISDEGGGEYENTAPAVREANQEDHNLKKKPHKKKKRRNNNTRKEAISEYGYDDAQETSDWTNKVDSWYLGLETYSLPTKKINTNEVTDEIPATKTSRNICENINLYTSLYCANHPKLSEPALYENISYSKPEPETVFTGSENENPAPHNSETISKENGLKWLTDEDDHKYYQHRHTNRNHSFFTHHVEVYDEELEQARKKYRERVGYDLVVPECNLKNVRSMTIGTESTEYFSNYNTSDHAINDNYYSNRDNNKNICINETDDDNFHNDYDINCNDLDMNNTSIRSSTPLPDNVINENTQDKLQFTEIDEKSILLPNENKSRNTSTADYVTFSKKEDFAKGIELVDISQTKSSEITETIDEENVSNEILIANNSYNSLEIIEECDMAAYSNKNESTAQDIIDNTNDVELKDWKDDSKYTQKTQRNESFSQFLAEQQKLFKSLKQYKCSNESRVIIKDLQNDNLSLTNQEKKRENIYSVKESKYNKVNSKTVLEYPAEFQESQLLKLNTSEQTSSNDIKCILKEVSNNNACLLLTIPNRLHTPFNSVQDVEITNEITSLAVKKNDNCESSKKKANRNVLRKLLLESLFESSDKLEQGGVSASVTDEVDSTIPFNCITSSEVVDSCVTTTSTTQATVAEDPKPLQLGSSYRAVASLTGAPPRSPPPRARPHTHVSRNLVATTFNSMALARNNYGTTATTAADEYKKSLDENGNAVQGFSSPLSGSSQHKKPRRKKSSKNETVITSHQIDGYQGNKDLKEVLRFIESNADTGRSGKLRAKHKDDSDDKGGKKRSTDRRKDKEKMKRANSMEELSRTKLEDLTDKPVKKERWTEGAGKAERRSWGDESREGLFYREEVSDADFQTVTKKRKPRRRADEAARPPRAPSPRSNDSTDDMEERAAAAAAALGASYAEITRTRHNIPDLIESCNYYAEDAAHPPPPAKEPYPALGTPTPRHHNNKELVAPAPDVVADRRPPVVLLDCGSRAGDMDGVTFGFDINEQLLGGVSGRPRCDLVLDAVSGEVSEVSEVTEVSGAGEASDAIERRGLRYVPPVTQPLNTHMLQIIDYVSSAWEDVVRCGNGKVRYFNE